MKKLVISLLTIAACAGGWYLYTKANPQSLFEDPLEFKGNLISQATTTPNLAKLIADASDVPPAGYVKYVNTKYGFSYYHSPEATVKEYDEGGGAMTIVQENVKNARGLQIFIVPYTKKQITDARFHLDEPSGVRYNIESTDIGKINVPAVTFSSYDDFLGETREVWFIHNNYLFEVTTFKGYGDWFGPIMQSWRFLCQNDPTREENSGCSK